MRKEAVRSDGGLCRDFHDDRHGVPDYRRALAEQMNYLS
jgi:hypothetical protein